MKENNKSKKSGTAHTAAVIKKALAIMVLTLILSNNATVSTATASAEDFIHVPDPFPDVQFDIRIAFGDFDCDGDIDALSQEGNVNGQGYVFTCANGDGTYTNFNQSGTSIPSSPFAKVDLSGLDGRGGFYGASVNPIDYDDDGDIDIISRSHNNGGSNFILRNDNGSFTRIADPFPDLTYDMRIEFADFDNDGDIDALAQQGNIVGQGYIYVQRNSDGSYTQFAQLGSSIPNSPFASVDLSGLNGTTYFAVDFDNDGDKDIINRSGTNYVLRNDNGTFTRIADPFADTQYDIRITFGDFDNDGDIDAIQQESNVVGQGYIYMQRNSDGTYTRSNQSGKSIPDSPFANVDFTGLNGTSFFTIDYDSDGDLDVISRSSSVAGGANFIFKCVGSPPILVSSNPADNSIDVAINTNIVLNLSSNITAGSGNVYIKKTSDYSIVETIAANSPKVTISESQITIDPTSDLESDMSYYLAFDLNAFLDSDSKGFGYLNEFVRAGFDNKNLLNFTTGAVAVAPGITGPTALNLTEGYAATSTGVYTTTGTTPVTVTKTSGDASITWNDTTKKLEIAAGLAAGSYVVELKASNGTTPDATLTFTLTVDEAPVVPVAPGITGPTALNLTEGYAATSTGVYTVTGTAPVTVTKTLGDGNITWNDTDKKLDIAAGLAAGSYVVELKASNGTTPDATLTFTLTVDEAPVVPVAPGITGPTALNLTEGYAATSTGVYTTTGTTPVAVTKTSGDASITWNDTTKKLEIAAGLAAGSYVVELKASNGTTPDATLTFTLTVDEAPVVAVAPGITGPTTLSLTEGYSAASTGVYSITGTTPVTVTKTSGNASITWNDTTKKLDITAGLAVGSYVVELKASNGTAPDATLTFTLTVDEAPVVPVAPGITGPTALNLTEGYAATSTGVYTVTGTAPVTVTKTLGDGNITWNDTDKKLDIAAGLAAGSYVVELKASNGTTPDATLTFTLTVDEAPVVPVAPGITGPTALNLTEGYAATSTGVYTTTGTAPVTVTKTLGDGNITWNDTDKKLDIAAGLAAGSYVVELKASNGTTPDATLTFTLTVDEAPVVPVAPGITGPTALNLTEGYAATSTGVYTTTGTAPVTVTKTSGDGNITWNDTDKKLDIAAGLAAGSYVVELKASNGTTPDATLTFTLTVDEAPVVPVAPGITGPTALNLTEGYAATSTGVYTTTGTTPVAVTKTSGDASITWNDTTKKLEIAAGLAAGSYVVELKASNGTTPDATLTFTLTVDEAPVVAVAPGITGPTTLSLTEGYSAASTGVYSITGTTPVTVTKTSGNASITWNDTTKKLDIAAGLAVGSYVVELKASNGTAPDATLTFTLTVDEAPVVPIAPGITGPTALNLTEGYAATSTGVYTVTGTAPVTVTKTSGDGNITWNDTDKKLDIAAGLAAGSYVVELKASNGTTPDATLTFTLTVDEAPVVPVAPGITGPTALNLTEGYAATSTGVYTTTGTTPVAVTKTSGDASITWNDTTKKLEIAAGLAAGSYVVELKASNGTTPDATLTFTLTVDEAPVVAVAPGITGPTTLSLTEEYSAASTGVYSITGTTPVTVTKTSGNASITWNDTTKKLDIAAGLAVGSYVVELKASNGTAPDATLTFTLTVDEAPVVPVAPGITGPTALNLTEGYAATSTGVYTVTGSALVIVTKTSGDGNITWNDTDKKLDIAAGLAAGSYVVELKASNGTAPDATLTFTLTVNEAPVVPVAPLAPTGVTATSGNTKVTLNWNSVAGATGYKIYQTDTSGTYGTPLASVEGSVYSYDITGLANGTTYYFVIKATKDGIDSLNSAEVSEVAKTVPGTPTNVSATAGNGQAMVSFTAPAGNGGSAITRYIVTSSPGNITATGTGTTIKVTGLNNGTTYTFTVKAVNAVGNGTNSTVSNTVTPQSPSNGGDAGGNTAPANPTPSDVTEITVDVMQGNTDSTVSQITIERKTESNGKKVDTVTYQESKAEETIEKLKKENKDTARIVIPDEKDEVSETKVNIPAKTLEVLAKGGINLQIDTEEAKIEISKNTITDISQGSKDDLYFRLVPVKDKTQKETAMKNALLQAVIVRGNAESSVSIIGNPVTIETNMSSTEADITLPLTGITIPSNPAERAALLLQLAVYIEHSDGDEELVQGELVEYKDGVYGIRFRINKFSTFTVVKTDAFLKDSDADILKVNIPSASIIKGTGITASVANKTSSVTVKIKVNNKAVWQLYSNKNCTKAITKNKLDLKAGANISYIKVTAEDGTSKVYKLTINRETSSAADIIKIITPTKATVKGKTVTATLKNKTASITVKTTVSDGAVWKLYSNKSCTKEILQNKLDLKVGINTAYVKVTAKNGKTSKVYTVQITRKEAEYKEHIKLGLIGSKTYAEKVAKIFAEEYDCKNVVVKPEGKYYRVTMDFIDKAVAIKICEDMIVRQYIIHYYFVERSK